MNWKNKFYKIMYACILRATSTTGSNATMAKQKDRKQHEQTNCPFKRAKHFSV